MRAKLFLILEPLTVDCGLDTRRDRRRLVASAVERTKPRRSLKQAPLRPGVMAAAPATTAIAASNQARCLPRTRPPQQPVCTPAGGGRQRPRQRRRRRSSR